MRTPGTPTGRGFVLTTAAWLGPILGGLLTFHLIVAPPRGTPGAGWLILHLLLGWTGILLPLVAFAAGIAVHPANRPRCVAVKAASLALLSYALMAYGSPTANRLAWIARGYDPTVRFPLGPDTPANLLLTRRIVEASPPDSFSFQVDRPLQRPPNWLTYLLHSPAAIAAFTVLFALIGWLTAGLTTGLSPPARLNARWATGVACGTSFLLVEFVGGDWVRADPSHSGLVAAWGPLALPLLILVIFMFLARRRVPGLSGLADPSF